MGLTISLLVSTYNWPQALELLLQQVNKQTLKPHEILIADDGSTEETKQVIQRFQTQTTIPVLHIWQEDDGFRKSKILNKAIAQATSDYIVQIDGDILMHPSFIQDHAYFAEEGLFLFGSRVTLTETKTAEILSTGKVSFSPFQPGLKRRTRAIYWPNKKNRKASTELSPKLRGCNISYWRKDAIHINGYNEDFEGWGNEDSEFALRLLNANIAGKRIKNAAIAFHLWHNERSKDNAAFNSLLENNAKNNKTIRCKNGIEKP